MHFVATATSKDQVARAAAEDEVGRAVGELFAGGGIDEAGGQQLVAGRDRELQVRRVARGVAKHCLAARSRRVIRVHGATRHDLVDDTVVAEDDVGAFVAAQRVAAGNHLVAHGAEGQRAAVSGKTIEDRPHPMLAYTEVKIPTGIAPAAAP